MKATIIHSTIGVFAFDEDNRMIEKTLFEKDAAAVAEKILKMENGEAIEELTILVGKLTNTGYSEFVFENSEVTRSIRQSFNVETMTTTPSTAGEILRKNMLQFAVDSGFIGTEQEFQEWVHKVSMALTRKRVQKTVGKRDLMVAQAILSIDDLDKTINLFMSRITEWYGLHFPELAHLLENQETYARLVSSLGSRENFDTEKLEKEGLQKDKAAEIANAAVTSIGASLQEDDIQQIQELCKATSALFKQRQKLESYVETTINEVAPNLQALAGSLLGARLIALAGGLDNLAKKPASTIQVLGAEKALFRALKTGARPPKHGVLFQHALIHEATRWQRGKVSRALAGKLAIAARIDAYGGKYAGEGLKTDLERRVKEVREKYAEPPPTPARQWQRPQKKPRGRFKRGRKR